MSEDQVAQVRERLAQTRALCEAATPGPWEWVDPDTDLPCTPDAPCAAGDHGEHAYTLSLRTVELFPTNSVGPLPKFIISSAEEFAEVQHGDGTWTHPDAYYIAAVPPDLMLRLVTEAEGVLDRHHQPAWSDTHCIACELDSWPCPEVEAVIRAWAP